MTRARDVATQGGLVLLNKTDFTSAATVSIDNVFSATYDNYKIIVNATASSATASLIRFIDTSGNTVSASYYSAILSNDYASAANLFYNGSTSSWITGFMATTGGERSVVNVDIFSPYVAIRTIGHGLHTGINIGSWYAGGFTNYQHTATTQFRGFQLLNTSAVNMTGNVQVYGYKKN